MPVVAILVGIVLIDIAFRGTEHEFATQLGKDFSGGGFWAWLAAIAIIGGLGYYSPLKKISDAGILLVVLGLALSNQGVFAQFANVIKSPPSPAPAVPLPDISSSTASSSALGGIGGVLGGLEQGLSIGNTIAGFL